jgi:pimeloyl-ACP methyl ester carboxylesterase
MQPMADKIPGAKFLIVEKAGHMTPIEQPDVINKVIKDFLVKINY